MLEGLVPDGRSLKTQLAHFTLLAAVGVHSGCAGLGGGRAGDTLFRDDPRMA